MPTLLACGTSDKPSGPSQVTFTIDTPSKTVVGPSQTPLNVSGVLSGPQAALTVVFTLTQGSVVATNSQVLQGPATNVAVTGTVSTKMGDDGTLFKTGAATLAATVSNPATDGGVTTNPSTNTFTINIVATPPTLVTTGVSGSATGSNGYFSKSGSASVSVVSLVNPAGAGVVDATSVKLTAGGTKYVGAQDSTNKAMFTFTIPPSGLTQTDGFQGAMAYTLEAADQQGNSVSGVAGVDSGGHAVVINIDNQKPALPSDTVTTTIYAKGQTVPLSVNVTKTGGADVTGVTATVGKLSNVALTKGAAIANGFTWNLPSTLAEAIQTAGQQGLLPVTFTATDGAGNSNQRSATNALKVDLAPPVVKSVAVNPGSVWYQWDQSGVKTAVVQVTVDDSESGSNAGSGAASATVTAPVASAAQTTSTPGSGTAKVYAIAVPLSAGVTTAPEKKFDVTAIGTDVAGNPATAVTATQALWV